MTNPLNNLKKEAESIRLSAAEKSAMRAAIFGAPSPVRPVRSPYVFASFFSYQVRMSLAALLLFVVAGAGSVSAAQGALPGDLLYTVKVSINEKVQVALAPSTAAKAEVEASLAARRVEEAEALASQGRLDATTTMALAANFDSHAQAAADLADAAQASDPGAGVDVKTTLAASLQAHGEILAKLGDESKSSATKEHAGVLAARVIARAYPSAAQTAGARAFVPSTAKVAPTAMLAPAGKVSSGSGEGEGGAPVGTLSISAEATAAPQVPQDAAGQKTAASLESKAAAALGEAKNIFDKQKGTIDATSTAQVAARLGRADDAMSAGSTALGAGDYASASAQFMSVLRTSAELRALLSAEQKYDNGIIRALLKSDERDQGEALDLGF